MALHDIAALVQEIQQHPAQCGKVRVIGIDGPAGSGKTTLAHQLSLALGECPVVHMDDLYNGWNQDLETELGQRIVQSILLPIAAGKSAHYEKFDWYANTFTSSSEIVTTSYLILEGVGSSNRIVSPYLSYRIWIEADPDVVEARIVNRDGPQVRSHLPAWRIKETQYFDSHSVMAHANLHLSGD